MSSMPDTWPSLGVELEMPTAHARTGKTHPVGAFFRHLGETFADQGLVTRLLLDGDREYGLRSPRGLHSLDNGYNNLESSLGPIIGAVESLDVLAGLIREEIRDVTAALAREDAVIINFSEHPDTLVTREFYYSVRAPKSLYDYQITHRGWNHMAGFDAKAHNSPSTGVNFEQAVAALNCLMALAPAFIALYANSPFEAGRITGCKENRMTLWSRQLDCSRMSGDHKLHRMPLRPFHNLSDYLTWMFGPGTQMWFATRPGAGKNPHDMHLVPGDPPLLDFLRGGPRPTRSFGCGEVRNVVPSMDHLTYHQFTQYTDCRLRYGLKNEDLDVKRFLHVLDERPDRMEELFQTHAEYCYVEGRSAGANYPDREIADMAESEVAASVAVSPSALQYGLLRDLDRTKRLVARYAWADLVGLRGQAMRHALEGEYGGVKVRDVCAGVLEIAGQELASEQSWMLAYPLWVLQTGKTGADRALERFKRISGPSATRLRKLVLERRVVAA
ncbi:MAG TPA: hypothetical protein ENN39_02195 [Desulfonatronum sp.]|nr:hypothetical protein [Desulfonatronum sp.]